jgi:hypothetical protein
MKRILVSFGIYIAYVGWTLYCVQRLWSADLHGGRYGIEHPYHGNVPSDLPFDYYWLIIEFIAFLIILRPETYDFAKSFWRSVTLLPLTLIAWVFHASQLMHAGSVHGWMMNWITGIVGLSFVLFMIGLYFRVFRGKIVPAHE